jgi:hypothetical protein
MNGECWYLGPATHHYQCYQVWAWITNAERVADTLTWFPTTTIMPQHSSTDIVISTAHNLTHAFLHPAPASSLLPLADSHRQQLLQLADIFQQHTQRPDQVPTEPPAELLSLVPAPPTVPIVTPSPLWDSSSPTDAPLTAPAPLPNVAPSPAIVPMVAPTATPLNSSEGGATSPADWHPLSSSVGGAYSSEGGANSHPLASSHSPADWHPSPIMGVAPTVPRVALPATLSPAITVATTQAPPPTATPVATTSPAPAAIPTTALSPKRITWVPSVTGNVSPIATCQKMQDNADDGPPRPKNSPPIEPLSSPPASPSTQASQAALGPSAAPTHVDHANASKDNAYPHTTPTI